MIEKILLSCLAVFAVWFTMQDGEIFDRLGRFLDRWLPEKMKSAVFECPICMFPYYGLPFYSLALNYGRFSEMLAVDIAKELIVVLFAGIGAQVLFNGVLQGFLSIRNYLEQENEIVNEQNKDDGDERGDVREDVSRQRSSL